MSARMLLSRRTDKKIAFADATWSAEATLMEHSWLQKEAAFKYTVWGGFSQ